MRILCRFAIVAMPLVLSLAAQEPDPAAKKKMVQDRVAALKESLAKNQAALKQYTWTETTQVLLKGEVKKNEQKQCRYGPDGKVQKTAIGGGSPPPQQQEPAGGGRAGRRGGGVKKKVVENKKEEMKDYMEQVVSLVHQYVPPDAGKIQEAAKTGNASIRRDTEGKPNALALKNYEKPNDEVTLAFDPAANKIRSYNVASYLDKPENAVTMAVSFGSLADGTNYARDVLLDAKSKQIQVKVTNSGHQKAAP
jgi:hypothetical protein